MTIGPKHEKLLAMAATSYGAPDEIYTTQAAELIRAGKLVRRVVFSRAGGYRKTRLFVAVAA